MQRKNILLGSVSVIFLFLLTAFTIYYSKIYVPKNTYNQISNVSLENELISKKIVDSCESPQYCIGFVTDISITKLKNEAKIFSLSISKTNEEEIRELVKKKKYRELVGKYEEFIKQEKNRIIKKSNVKISVSEIKNLVNENSNIKMDLFQVGYSYSENNYLLVNIDPVDDSSDPGNIIYKNNNGKWEVIYGPGTYFEIEPLLNMGVPKGIIEKLPIMKIDQDDNGSNINYPTQDNSNIDPGLE